MIIALLVTGSINLTLMDPPYSIPASTIPNSKIDAPESLAIKGLNRPLHLHSAGS
jgi:hypothetical protein